MALPYSKHDFPSSAYRIENEILSQSEIHYESTAPKKSISIHTDFDIVKRPNNRCNHDADCGDSVCDE